MLEKNKTYAMDCRAQGAELEGVCDADGMTVFVPGALRGERIEALIVKASPSYAFGRLTRVLTPSPDRAEPFCPAYVHCGGCGGQHMSYAATLAAKRAQVLDNLNRIGGLDLSDADVPPVMGADEPRRYRNKTSLPVGGTSADPIMGFYRRRSHSIVPTDDCEIAMGDVRGVISAVREWIKACGVQPYDELTGKGFLRHVVVRASRDGSLMVVLAATSGQVKGLEALISLLRERAEGFRALHISVNAERGNVIMGTSSQRLWGDEVITETLCGLKFEIAPLSFFQVNPAQTERLYAAAIDMAALRPDDTVADAYAGAGTISLCMARRARRVTGIEIVPQAVESARRNARLNGIQNADFHEGAVEDVLPRLVGGGMRPDVLVLDPPRKGVEPQVIEAALKARPRRVVYVSCHTPTQARDLKLLCEGGYSFEGCRPVDMFCYAGGVENIVSVIRREDDL